MKATRHRRAKRDSSGTIGRGRGPKGGIRPVWDRREPFGAPGSGVGCLRHVGFLRRTHADRHCADRNRCQQRPPLQRTYRTQGECSQPRPARDRTGEQPHPTAAIGDRCTETAGDGCKIPESPCATAQLAQRGRDFSTFDRCAHAQHLHPQFAIPRRIAHASPPPSGRRPVSARNASRSLDNSRSVADSTGGAAEISPVNLRNTSAAPIT